MIGYKTRWEDAHRGVKSTKFRNVTKLRIFLSIEIFQTIYDVDYVIVEQFYSIK